MARPTKHAPKISVATGVCMVIGAAAALVTRQPMWGVVGLLPATIYQVYRTEGESTTWASWVLLAVLVLEGIVLLLGVDVDLATLLGRSSETVAGYEVPLGSITAVGPVVMAVLSMILIARTRGRYTKWLAVIILVGSAALIYVLDPAALGHWFREALELGLNRL